MKILVVDELGELYASVRQALDGVGHSMVRVSSASEAFERLAGEAYHLVFFGTDEIDPDTAGVIERFDGEAPHLEVIVFSPSPSVGEAVEAMQSGATDFVALPCSARRIVRLVHQAEESRRSVDRIADLEERLQTNAPPVRFESDDACMREVLEMASRVALTPTTVLLLGESGTGKSLLARAIHEAADSCGQSFVTISCPSLSRELLESELFGHVRGAFTGAVKDKFGKVAAAEGGTLFLDEIGELPMELQPKLLRLLQEHEYERVGETRTRKADVRIIAATNRDLQAAVDRGEFREDLYYRLNVVPITLPPLRDRPNDLERIASDCLEFYSRLFGRKIRGLHPKALQAMKTYLWPGNLRELDNVIERSVILANGEFVELADLPTTVRDDHDDGDLPVGEMMRLEDLEKLHIKHVIDRTLTLEEAAKVLGIDKSTLFRKRKRYGLV